MHEAERDETIRRLFGRARAAERAERGVGTILEQADVREALCRRTALAAREPGAEGARLGEVRGPGLARDVGDEIVERAGAITGGGARESAREARLLDIERDGAIDPRTRQRVEGLVLRGVLSGVFHRLRLRILDGLSCVLRAAARARDAADARDERPEPGAVVPERRHRRVRKHALERVGRDGRRDVGGRVGERLVEQIAAEARRIADIDPLLGLLEEGARVVRRAGGARRWQRRGEAGAAVRELRPQRAQIGPGRLERERVAQRLVGAIGLERPALAREQAAERAPGLGVRRREVDGDLELARRLVDAAERLERAPAQEARALPRRALARERLGGGERVLGAAGRERARGLVGARRLRRAHLRRRPRLERVPALVERDGVEEVQHALALCGREGRRDVDAEQRLEPRARRRRAPDGALEVGDAQEQVEAPLSIVLQRREALLEVGDDRPLPIPARRIVGQQVREIDVRVEAPRILVDGDAEGRFRLRAPAELGEREAEIGRERRVPRIRGGGAREELGRLRGPSRAQAREAERVIGARPGARRGRGRGRRRVRALGARLRRRGRRRRAASVGRASVGNREPSEQRERAPRHEPLDPRSSRRRRPSWFSRR